MVTSSTPRVARRTRSRTRPTGQTIAEVAEGGAADVDRAVEAARRAAPTRGWPRSPGRPQADPHPLRRPDRRARRGARPDRDARCRQADHATRRALDIPESAATIRWHAEATDKLYDQVAPTGPGAVAMIVREPIGVVGAVVPWNYPLQMAAWKLGPALATGNAVVMKPASVTSLSLLRDRGAGGRGRHPRRRPERRHRAGRGRRRRRSRRHPDIDGVAFTGSTEVGRTVPRARGADEPQAGRARARREEPAGRDGRRRRISIGSPDRVANAIFWNMGENCSAGLRLIVAPLGSRTRPPRRGSSASSSATGSSATRWTTRPGSGRSSPRRTWRRSSATSTPAGAEGARAVVGGSRVLEETRRLVRRARRSSTASRTRCGSPARRSSGRSCRSSSSTARTRRSRIANDTELRPRRLGLHRRTSGRPTGWRGRSRPAPSA